MAAGEGVRDIANQKRELERYFISEMLFYFPLTAVTLTVIVLSTIISNLVYGNPLINQILYGEIWGKILSSIILIASIIGVFSYGLVKYRKRIFWKTPPYVSKKLNAVFNVGLVWMFISGLYFITHFSNFLSDFGTYTSYSLFNGYAHYLTGDFGFALNYSITFPMVQSEVGNWALWLYWIILPLFVVSLLMVMGVIIYVKYKK
jgi:hypothetical protein